MAGADSRLPVPTGLGRKYCPSCGETEGLGRRKYCSLACRGRLAAKLDVLSGLLRAIHTRYAAFSFTDTVLVLNVVVWGSSLVYTFLWQRAPNIRPADDLARMTEELGRIWRREHNSRNSRHQASLSVLASARTGLNPKSQVRPHAVQNPRVGERLLTVLAISKKELAGDHPKEAIKSAFRRQALKHHPDRQGDPAAFRKIQTAYEELLRWTTSPSMTVKTGLPDKWSFNGKRWAPPMRPTRLPADPG